MIGVGFSLPHSSSHCSLRVPVGPARDGIHSAISRFQAGSISKGKVIRSSSLQATLFLSPWRKMSSHHPSQRKPPQIAYTSRPHCAGCQLLLHRSNVGEQTRGLDNQSAPPCSRRIEMRAAGLKSVKHFLMPLNST